MLRGSNDTGKKIVLKHHPDVYDNDTIVHEDGIYQCRGKEVNEYCSIMYCIDDIHCICLECISDRKTAEKLRGDFIRDAESDLVSDPQKTEELSKRTPGYASWQGEYWLACCNDCCVFIGDVGIEELERMGIADKVFAEYDARDEFDNAWEYLEKSGSLVGYLFRCLYCGIYHLWVNAD